MTLKRIAPNDTRSIVTPERGRPADVKISAKKVIETTKAALRTATSASVPVTQRSKDKTTPANNALIGRRTRLMTEALMDTADDAQVEQKKQPQQSQSFVIPMPQSAPGGFLSIDTINRMAPMEPVSAQAPAVPTQGTRKSISISSILGNAVTHQPIGMPKKL